MDYVVEYAPATQQIIQFAENLLARATHESQQAAEMRVVWRNTIDDARVIAKQYDALPPEAKHGLHPEVCLLLESLLRKIAQAHHTLTSQKEDEPPTIDICLY